MTTSYTLIRMNKPPSSQQTHSSYNGNMNNAHFKSQSQSSQSSSRAPSAPPMFKPKDIVPCNDTLLQCLDNINNIILNGASININHSFLKGFYSYLCIAVFSICEPKSKNNRGYVTSIWIDYSANGTTWICHNNTDGEYKLEYSQLDNNIFGAMDNTNSHDKYAEIEIWPPIHARFIRIRPTKYCISIAMRFDFYGPSTNRLEYARVIKYGDLSEEDRHSANLKLKHATMNTRLIQVDCKAVIRKALNDAGMSYVGFVETDKNNYLCVFSTADLTATERTIEELMDIGIGTAMGVAGICPMQFRRPTKQEWKDKQWEAEENKKFQEKHHVTAGFYASIKSRQIVDQMVDSTTQSAEFTYDYMSMLIVADVIAAMGLGTDSSVIVVASMLVSPIMGPVLALTFGVHLCKFKFAKALALLGLKNEIWSLIICILVGFIVGFIFIAITENDVNGEWPWPTNEMVSRGQWVGLVTGAVVAFASGVGVALSVVGDYTATVIGVAISASLLPPAVNCGMLWAMSVYVYIWPGRGCNVDECYDPNELAVMGTVSIILTIENIILVFLASWMMFCIKDVTLGARAKMMEDGNRQLVYQSITSFKDRYDDVKMRSSSYNLSRQKRPSLKHLSVAGETKNYLGKRLDDLTVDHTQKNKTLKKSIMRANTLVAHKGGYGYEGINRTQTELDGIILEDEEYTDFDEEYEFPGGKSKISLRLSNTDNSSRIQKIHTDSTNTLGVLQENESEPLVQNNSNTNPNIGQVIEMTDDDQHK
eukprot:141101_1